MAPVPGDSSKHQYGTSMPQGGHPPHHSITSSAIASRPEGMAGPKPSPSAKLTTNSNFVDCSTGNFLRPGLRLQELLRAVVGLLRVLHRGLLHGDVGLLQIGIDGEQQHAALDLIAFPHCEHLDATCLVGTDEDQFGLDPALKGRLFSSIAACEEEGREQCEREAAAAHVPLLVPNSTSRCARMRLAHVERRQAPEQGVPYDGYKGGRDQQLRKAG